jgi:uridine kinase
MKKPFVISISVVSGGGKTTVTNALKDILINSMVISFDDYDDIKLDRDIRLNTYPFYFYLHYISESALKNKNLESANGH